MPAETADIFQLANAKEKKLKKMRGYGTVEWNNITKIIHIQYSTKRKRCKDVLFITPNSRFLKYIISYIIFRAVCMLHKGKAFPLTILLHIIFFYLNFWSRSAVAIIFLINSYRSKLSFLQLYYICFAAVTLLLEVFDSRECSQGIKLDRGDPLKGYIIGGSVHTF